MTDATRSIEEWAASVRIAIEPVIAPAAIFAAIRSEFEATETQAAPALVLIISRPRSAPPEGPLGPLIVDVDERADIGHPAILARGGHLAQELVEVLLVARSFARVPRRPDAGRGAERAGLDPGVVGDRGLSGRLARRAGLDQRVVVERLPVLGR